MKEKKKRSSETEKVQGLSRQPIFRKIQGSEFQSSVSFQSNETRCQLSLNRLVLTSKAGW